MTATETQGVSPATRGLPALNRGTRSLAYLVNTTTEKYPSTVVLTFDCTEWDGEIAVHDPDGKVTGAVLLPLTEAKAVLASSTATRPEIEPLLDYLDSLSAGRVWSYRDDLPIE